MRRVCQGSTGAKGAIAPQTAAGQKSRRQADRKYKFYHYFDTIARTTVLEGMKLLGKRKCHSVK